MASSNPISRSSAAVQSGRTLAVDYGRRRIGLAISDELGITAEPLPILERKNRRDDIRRLRDVARQYTIALIIVGSPVHLDGHAGEMAEEASRFAARLQKELGLPVKLRDERLTTWEAEQTLREVTGRKGRGANVDSVAAAILLREYLEENRRRESAKDRD